MEAAVFGLLGVALGAILTVAREWWFQSRKERKESEFLAVQVVGQLDRFVAGCASVVADDGLCEGRPDEDGYRRSQVTPPKFEPESLKVEWKSLPTTLMYEILDLPYKAEIANHRVSGAFEHAANPPDVEEGFEERQYQYATLGLEAARLAKLLRTHAKLPSRTREYWDPEQYMKEEKATIVELRDKRIANHVPLQI